MRGVPAPGGCPARGVPTLLDPLQAEDHEPGPLPVPSLSRAVGGLGVGLLRAGPLSSLDPETKTNRTMEPCERTQ